MLALRRFARWRRRCPVDGHRDAPRILPDVLDPDVDAVADARLEPPHDDQRPAHALVVANGHQRTRRHPVRVADRRTEPAAGGAAVLELPDVMRHAEFVRRRRIARSVLVARCAGRRFRVPAVDGDRDLLDLGHRRPGGELLLLLVAQHAHDLREADDGFHRRRHALAFAAAIDTTRFGRVVAGDLAQQLDLPGAPERRRDGHGIERIAQRFDFGVDQRQHRGRIEPEGRGSGRRGCALQPFGAVQIDDETIILPRNPPSSGCSDTSSHQWGIHRLNQNAS